MNELYPCELVARERTRVEALLAEQVRELRAAGSLRRRTEEYEDAASEKRIAQGNYGLSVESGLPIPDQRLEAEPLAERTIEEQMGFETHGSRRF